MSVHDLIVNIAIALLAIGYIFSLYRVYRLERLFHEVVRLYYDNYNFTKDRFKDIGKILDGFVDMFEMSGKIMHELAHGEDIEEDGGNDDNN